jgi:ATP-dependent RNA helicase DDX10/DBP4
MEEEDKYDKELFRQRIKAKHREDRLKAKAERRLANRVEKEEEENVDGEEDEESGDDESVDGSVADIIDALPDPDRIYGAKEDDSDEEGDVYRGPAVAK